MKAKQSSFLLCSLFFFFQIQSTIDPIPYQKNAQLWIEHYIYKENQLLISYSDLQLIANLFYFSYLRSLHTITAQVAAQKAFESLWHGWQNIAHTRMNPSLKAPHMINYELQRQYFDDFTTAQQEHRRIGSAYSYIAEVAVKQQQLSAHAQEGVSQVREHARTIVAHAFLDAKKIIGDLYEVAIQGLRDYETDPDFRFNLLDSISYYLPILSMHSFIEAENAQLKAGQQSWQIINTMLNVNMCIWDTIETARASYYLAHYNALTQVMTRIPLEKTYWTILVDEQGFNKQPKNYLPKLIL